jgi:hypothetical protein
MTSTTATGFVTSTVGELTVVRSLPHATGAGIWPERPLTAPEVVSKAHLELAEPQAAVIYDGVATAGGRAELDALAKAAQAARTLGLDVEEVLVVSTGGEPHPRTARARGGRFAVRGLATTPALVTTDYPLAPSEAAELLRSDASAVVLASGAAELERTPASDEELALVLGLVCRALSLKTISEVAA